MLYIMRLIFFILISFISIKYILYWTYIWQLKEYRLDRIKDFFLSKEGKNYFLNKIYLSKIILLIINFIFCFLLYNHLQRDENLENIPKLDLFLHSSPHAAAGQKNLFFYIILIIVNLLLLMENAVFFKRILEKKVIKPAFTKKIIAFIFISGLTYIFTLTISFLIFNWPIFISIALLAASFIFLFSSLANIILLPISSFLKRKKIILAKKIRENFSELKVIGITGSYGKTSVKEITSALLGKKFKVLKTPGNINTEIGIADFIIKEFKVEAKSKCLHFKGIFVCEMGAYKVGEIKKICEMVKPQLGILTGINEQHFALFGSIENTIKAKSELMKSLPEGGLAIINNDDENCRLVNVREGIKKITYGFSEKTDIRTEICRLNIKKEYNEEEIFTEFKVHYKNINSLFRTKITGRHNIQNLLPAIAIACELGLKLDEISNIIESLDLPESLTKVKKIKAAIVIDDTYNANPCGVKAALEMLDNLDRKFKVLVLDDIWELGKEAKRIHTEIGGILAKKNYDKILLIGRDYGGLIKEILVKNSFPLEKISLIDGFYSAGEKILEGYFEKNSAILLEGRRARRYLAE